MLMKFLASAAGLLIVGAVLAQPSQIPAQIELSNAWARATAGKAENGVAYVTISSPTADRLVSVTTPVAKKAELHTMTMKGTVMEMRPAAGLDIPARQPVNLKPGGEHIMLLGLEQPLREGETFPLTLTFEKAGPRAVTATVEKLGAAGPSSAQQH